MADEKVVFDVVTDGSDTPHVDAAGVSYKLSTGTRSSNTVGVYSSSLGSILGGQMEILTPDSTIGDNLIISADITATDIFDPATEHFRGTGVVTGIADPQSYCLVTTGLAGQSEHGIFENSFALSSEWKVRFIFDLDGVTETSGYITCGADFIILMVPGINRIQLYYKPTSTTYNLTFNTDFGVGTGQHSVDIYQDGTDLSISLDDGAEIRSMEGVIPAPTFSHMLTNANLAQKFVGKSLQIIYYSHAVEVRKYTFNSQSIVEELCDITGESLLYTNVISTSWVTC